MKGIDDSISRREAEDIVRFECGEWKGLAETIVKRFEALPSAQPELVEKVAYIRGFEQGRTQGMIDTKVGKSHSQTCNQLATDTIRRQAAINAVTDELDMIDHVPQWVFDRLEKRLKQLPSAQPEVRPIDYKDCSFAMLKMWVDNVVTDGEYNRIMDKLNAHWGKQNG